MKNIFKFCFALLTVFVFGNVAFAITADITQINFTSSSQTIDVNTNSAILTVQTQNSGGSSESLDTSGTVLELTSSSATGEFYNANASACTDLLDAPPQLTMASGTANKHFCYKDSTAGTHTLTISAQGQIWTSATQDIVIAEAEEDSEEDPPLLIEADIALENGCTVTDTEGESHIFPQDDSPSEYLGICALVAAQEDGHISGFELANSDFGLYVESVNGIAPGATEFWALWKNEAFADCGISCLPIEANDTLSLILTDWMTNAESATITLQITELVSPPEPEENNEEEEENGNDGGSGGGGNNSTPTFSTESALSFLKNVQKENGSFEDSLLYTDWAAIAFGALDVNDSSESRLLAYLESHNEISDILTDNERRAMALLSLGQNPYSMNGINYIGAITGSFDGAQLGDINLDNDDIFGLIVLPKAGYTIDDEIISKTISFILSAQASDGSWDNSIDMTAAAIQALKLFDSEEGVSDALSEASDYLSSEQGDNGGWNDSVSSTSWAMQAESALGTSWIKNNKTGLDYLAEEQADDGAVSPSSETIANRVWATSYALAAASEKSWNEIMQSVPKPENRGGSSNHSPADATEKLDTIVPEIKPEIKIEPVVCPKGHLFSAETGEACTEIDPVIPAELPQAPLVISAPNSERVSASSKSQKASASPDLPAEENTAEEIIPETLAASAGNALPAQKIPPAIPVVLGTASGLVVLYFLAKFLIFT